MARGLKTETTNNRQVNQIQQNTKTALSPILNSPFGSGVLLENVVINANQNTVVQTGLGRPARGWIIVRNQAPNPTVTVEKASDDTSITLFSSLGCTLSLWIWG